MSLPEFASEAEFRTKWIAPFLSKVGYILVNHIHGSGEQGKDFFCADYDQFEHRRFYAIQAKNGKIGAGKAEIDELLNQVRRCFTVKLRFHKEADEKRVSGVYIMASGNISREAREYISDWCKSEHFGENVFYLDGDTLERLDKHAFQRADKDLRNVLKGVVRECQYNELVISNMLKLFENRKVIFERNRHLAIDQLLTSPAPDELLAYPFVQHAWHYITKLNKLSDYHLFPMSTSAEEWASRVDLARKGWEANLRLRDLASEAIAKLDERYSITVEVVE